jgi:hypothetical protein
LKPSADKSLPQDATQTTCDYQKIEATEAHMGEKLKLTAAESEALDEGINAFVLNDIQAKIAAFRERCEEAELTDTEEFWELLTEIQERLKDEGYPIPPAMAEQLIYLVISGNPVEGDLSIHGPFDDHEKAVRWAERTVDRFGHWQVIAPDDPKEFETRNRAIKARLGLT